MSRQPILLWKPNRTRATDDAGTDISKYEFPVNIPGPYEEVSKLIASKPSTYVPSLRALCIRQLATYPDQLDWLGAFRIYYEKPKSPSEYDLVRSLVPGYSHENPKETGFLKDVDPRLWAAMIQIISPLPDVFRSYDIPLSDTHVPLLQQIPSSPDFSLITVVQLYGRKEVDDDTIDQLGALHSLVALDVGRTPLSSWGIERLSYTLLTDGLTGSRRGPWSLRVLYLWDCMFIESSVIKALSKFPLISVVDLRGTKCKPSSAQGTRFGLPPQDSKLYHPTPLSTSLSNLSALAAKADPEHPSRLFSHPKPYILHITTLHHTATNVRTRPQAICYSGSDTNVAKSRYFLDDVDHQTRRIFLSSIRAGPPDRDLQALVRIADSRARASVSISHSNQNPLMLFRLPPPYDTSKSTSPSTSAVRRSLKRHRSESAMKTLFGNDARNTKKARESVESVMSLVGKKVETAAPIAGPSNFAQSIRNNPFQRRSDVHSGIDPDLLAKAAQDRARPLTKVALGKQPQRPFPNGDDFKEPTRPRSAKSVSSRTNGIPTIDPTLLASVEASRRDEMEKEKAKASKVRTKKNRKIVRKSAARPDSDLSSSDDATIHSDGGSPPSLRRQKKSKIRLAPITAPPEKLKPLTALPMPPLPPELRKDLKIDTEAHKAILLGTKGKRRKSEESSSGLKQLTLAAFTTPSSSSSGRLSLGSSGNSSSTKKFIPNNLKKRR